MGTPGVPTELAPPTPEAPPPPPAPEPPPPAPGIPEPPAPGLGGQAIPAPPAPATSTGGLEGYQREAAEAFWMGVGNARTRPEALTTILRQYGYLPEGVPIDHVPDVLAQYAEYLAQSGGMAEEAPPALDGQPPAMADPGVQAALSRLDQLEQRELARAQQEEQAIVRGSVGRVAGSEGLDATGQEILLSNVSMALARAVQAGQQIDVDRLDEWVGQVLASLRSFGQAQMNQDIAAHRRMAPNTITPQGAPQGGGGYSPGMKGSEERAMEIIRQAEQARASGA